VNAFSPSGWSRRGGPFDNIPSRETFGLLEYFMRSRHSEDDNQIVLRQT
jgi:hypothetical protein